MKSVTFAAKLENLDEMFDFIKEACAIQGFVPEQAEKIKLACEEALVNVINYAYPGKTGDVEIRYTNHKDALEIVIVDSGIAFDPLSRPEPDIHAPLEERKIGGLGIFMIKQIMDEVKYKRESGHNILTLIKFNTCNPKDSHADKKAAKPQADTSCRWPIKFMKKETFKKGESLFKKGDTADRMFYIAKGAVNLVEINKIIKEGEVIGEMGIFSPYKERTASAVCEEDLEAYTMGKDEVIRFFGQDPAMAIELIKLSIKRFIENLKAETAARERIESELRIAQEIQASMLPNVFPQRKEFELFAMMDPAKEVGGDFYDFFFVDDKRLCFVIGDVSGKGVPAALFMAISKTLIKNEAKRGLPTDEILSRVNNIISPDNSACQFVTVFCAILDIESGEMQYCNGGHNPPLLRDAFECPRCEEVKPDCDKSGCFKFMKIPGGFVVGVMPNINCQKKTLTIHPGGMVFLYTDGVTEAMNPEHEQYSENRLKKFMTEIKDKNIKDMVSQLREEVRKFASGAPQSDDITMLALRYLGRGA